MRMYYDIKQSGERIRQLRIKNGYTQEKLAHNLNIDRSFYSRIESGQKGCSVDLLVRLSDCFQVSLDYLVLGKTQETIDVKRLKTQIEGLVVLLEDLKASL